AGAHDRRPEVGGHRPPRRHPQLRHPAAGEADSPDRRLRPTLLHLQLPRPYREPTRHGHHDPQALPGGVLLVATPPPSMLCCASPGRRSASLSSERMTPPCTPPPPCSSSPQTPLATSKNEEG